MREPIVFGNGETHNCTFFAATQTDAFIAIDDLDIAQAAALFSDQTKTGRIVYGSRVLVGFEKLVMICSQPYGVQATLQGGTVQPIGNGG